MKTSKKIIIILFTIAFFIGLPIAIYYGLGGSCAYLNCANGGKCTNGSCECLENYSGKLCEIDEICKNKVCENNGICKNGKCVCTKNFFGPSCKGSSVLSFSKK
jgi:hypothetical protein